jgi:hypothetical protein
MQFVNDVGSSLYVRQFVNNYTPTEATLVGNLTEATYTGYAAVLLGTGTYGGLSAQDSVIVNNASATFTAGMGVSPTTVYGWYLTMLLPYTGSTMYLLYVELYDVPINITVPGVVSVITPTFYQNQGTAT